MVKDIINLDFESIIDESVAEKYREDYELFSEVLTCYKKMTLKEYAYCKEHKINECEFIKEKCGDKDGVCKECNEGTFFGGEISILAFIIALIILGVAVNLISKNIISVIDCIYKIFQ